ncbi:MAG: hypothetical protein SFY81_13665 [Verrucomicrobiota bacterium]|nr:hypothetical protein [Verrucomicrobiota bacterium]
MLNIFSGFSLNASLLLLLLWGACGCARLPEKGERPLRFPEDTLAFTNETAWSYNYDANGKWVGTPREPRPDYVLRCFVLARSVREFLHHAEFHPELPPVSEEEYEKLIKRVRNRSVREWERSKIIIPGYANLNEFSAAKTVLLQHSLGGAWQSYVQRGHWRMIFPFSQAHQKRTAHRIVEQLGKTNSPILHVVKFPALTINHAVVAYGFQDEGERIVINTYDPNDPLKPLNLIFKRSSGRFYMPQTPYFPGGQVDIYDVYRNVCY